MEIKILGSSSKGNCYFLKTANQILILECGLSHKIIKKALRHDLSKVAGCLITHEHKDHCKAAQHLADAQIDIYSTAQTLEALELSGHRTHAIDKLKKYQIGEFTVLPFETQHDAADPVGFLIHHPEIGKLVFATDTYYLKYKFTGLNYVMVECNYSDVILDSLTAIGKLKTVIRRRLMRSHFSLERVLEFLQANDLSAVREIYLMHLSDGHSDEKLFKKTVQSLTGIPTIIC